MRYNQRTHEEFLTDLILNNEYYRAGDFVVKQQYKTCKDKLLLGTKYGDVKVRASHLLNGLKFTIESAVNKSEFAFNRVKEIYGNEFDLSRLVYTRSRDNIIIGCKTHGFIDVQFNNLMQRGCPKCGKDLLKELSKDNGGWSYSKWQKIGEKSCNFDSFKVYLIRCWNEEECFYKIGKTFTSVNDRFKGKGVNVVMPYEWEIIKEYPLEDALTTSKFEIALKNIHSDYRYTPKISFPGHRECFSKII